MINEADYAIVIDMEMIDKPGGISKLRKQRIIQKRDAEALATDGEILRRNQMDRFDKLRLKRFRQFRRRDPWRSGYDHEYDDWGNRRRYKPW